MNVEFCHILFLYLSKWSHDFLYLILLIWMFISIPTLGKLSAIDFSSKLSARFSLSSRPAPLSCEYWSTWCFPINPLIYLFFSLFSSLFALLIRWVLLPVLWFLWFFSFSILSAVKHFYWMFQFNCCSLQLHSFFCVLHYILCWNFHFVHTLLSWLQ